MEDILAGELAMHFFFVNPRGLTVTVRADYNFHWSSPISLSLSLALSRSLSRHSLIVWRVLIIFSFPEVLIPEQKTHGDGRDKYEAGCD